MDQNAARGAAGVQRGHSTEQLRRHNLSTILGHVHVAGPSSRSDLAALTGLNRSTIADLVGELAALGLVDDEGVAPGSGPGRPSALVQVRPHAAVVLAVELAVDSVAVATIGLGGHIYNRVRIDRPRGRFSPDETVEDVANLAQPLLAALPDTNALVGVGVGVVGVTRRSDGFVHLAPNLGWRDVPLGAAMARALEVGVPVSVANEADLGALGEHLRGAGSGVSHLIFVSGEVGIGTGLIVGGTPLLGATGYAGEAGHMLINPAGTVCRCGAIGCWETEAGEGALLQHAGLSGAETGDAGVDAVIARAERGDPAAVDAIAKVGHWLGVGIGDLINLFNPERVVLGGMFHRLFPLIEAHVHSGVGSRALAAPARLVTVTRAGLGVDAPLVGAAELALSAVVAAPASVREPIDTG